MKKILFLSLAIFFFACTSTKKISTKATNTTTVTSTTQDGSSYETAIVITEKTEGAGVKAEYKWLNEHYPGYTRLNQSLTTHNKKPFDILKIKTAEGSEKQIYFDISNFFGKW